ncbi:AraC family transcriptional regulator [Paenibacillus sp. VTT E-133280]|uniref:AraC family transcriptional regulator n=1 Tax=Paenibacillus sp. VTT E-133280 TaxID=1986222 RepID=UPI00211AD929|nr:helix-turn-helix domain-containing protein [Paenibacillus sp. VTT E-133280]
MKAQPNDLGWIAQWESTQPIPAKWITAEAIHYFTSNTLIIITDGQAIWNMNGHRVQVSFGNLIAIEPNSFIEVLEGGNLDLAGWQIQFDTYSPFISEGKVTKFNWHVPVGNTYQIIQLTGGFLTSISDRLNENLPSSVSESMVGNQHLLYGLLKNLYQKQSGDEETTEKGILRSIDYIQEHYSEMISREQLAQIAGISQWHYSRKFSEQCGKPPLDYLANYRIYRAKEEILLTSAKSQEIAKKVGFEDVHYFSRRFKHFAGVSPRNYAQQLHQRYILSISPLCAEVLIELGIIPHAVMVTPLLVPQHQRELFKKHHVKLLEVPQYDTNIELIQQEQPELIIGHFLTEDIKKKMRTIAPIITGLTMDIDILLSQLAALFQMKEEAEKLQTQMENEINEARQQLQPIVQSGATVMVLRVEAFGYRYLGGNSSGVSQLLYTKLELSLPEFLKTGEAWFNPCSIEQLYRANPDYLFVEKRVMENFSAEENMDKLMESEPWRNLKAVKNNHVSYIDTSLWVDGCGVNGQKIIIDQIVSNLISH